MQKVIRANKVNLNVETDPDVLDQSEVEEANLVDQVGYIDNLLLRPLLDIKKPQARKQEVALSHEELITAFKQSKHRENCFDKLRDGQAQ